MNKLYQRMIWLSLVVTAVLILAACAPAAVQPTSAPPTNAPPAQPTSAQPTSAQPTSAPPTSAPPAQPTSAPTGQGSTLNIAMYQEPESLNPYLSVQTVVNVVAVTVMNSLLDIDPKGNFIPGLAAQVPTTENGGISEDGLTLTYKLREGVKWADGTPFTSKDVKFTWDAIMDPANVVNSRAGYEDIASIETPDDLTAVVKFKKLYAPALTLFPYIMPSNAFGGGTTMKDAAFNRQPFGTGPYRVTEWASGESIILDKNPNYWVSGEPKIDRIIFKITPSREASVTQIKAGDADVVWDLIEASIPEFENSADVALLSTPSSNVEYLGLNTAKRGDPADPSVPHPILGDVNVRKAISEAIDRKVLVDQLLYGKSSIATSAIGLGWAADPSITMAPYNPEDAKKLLEAAGWQPGADGIRVKEGQRLSLEIMTTSGNKLRELAEQVIQEQLKAVGIELVINNVPSSTLFGAWDKNGPLKRGNFDVSMDTWGPDFDPNDFLSILFESTSIPTTENSGAGWNYFRLKNTDLDKLIADGRSTVDLTKRKQAYSQVARLINDSYAYVPLYNRLLINAFNKKVTGHTPNPWEQFTWDIANWSIQQ